MDTAPSAKRANRALAGVAAVVIGVGATFATILAAWTLSYVTADRDAAPTDYLLGAGVLLIAAGCGAGSVLLWRNARRL